MKAVLLLVAENERDKEALLGCKWGLAVSVTDSRSGVGMTGGWGAALVLFMARYPRQAQV